MEDSEIVSRILNGDRQIFRMLVEKYQSMIFRTFMGFLHNKEDAEYIGMKSAAKVISSEYDAPSTIVQKSGKVFQEYFEKADLIISKGQGNLEGLSDGK